MVLTPRGRLDGSLRDCVVDVKAVCDCLNELLRRRSGGGHECFPRAGKWLVWPLELRLVRRDKVGGGGYEYAGDARCFEQDEGGTP